MSNEKPFTVNSEGEVRRPDQAGKTSEEARAEAERHQKYLDIADEAAAKDPHFAENLTERFGEKPRRKNPWQKE